MTLTLDCPTREDLRAVLGWRKTCPEALRTPREITPLEQDRFYEEVIANRTSPHRYYAVRKPCDEGVSDCHGELLALVSLEHISWENGHGELGLIVDPARQGQGIGRQAVALALDMAFNRLRLVTVWGEAYLCGHPMFWERIVRAYGGTSTIWPRRKFWAGALHDAMLFTVTVDGWRKARREP